MEFENDIENMSCVLRSWFERIFFLLTPTMCHFSLLKLLKSISYHVDSLRAS